MSKIKLLYLVQLPPPLHGVSQINAQIVTSLLINKHLEAHIIKLNFSKSISELRSINFKKLLLHFVILFKIIKALICNKPHYVYFSIMPTGIGYLRDFSYVLLFKLAGVTPIFHLHNQGIYEKSKNRIFLKMYKFTFSNSSVIHLSEGLLKKEIISLKASNCYTYVVKNGIPIRDRTLPRKNFDISGNVIPVLFLSHILPLKGLETLIETMRLLNASELYPPLKLYLAGAFYSKHYKRKILKRIESQKLMPQIEILGELNENDKQEYFRKCKYFVFPSFSDTLGLVVLEAMQAGLACIVTNSGALPEYFEENKDCFFVNPGNASALAKALSNLVSSPQLASEIAESGRRKVMYYSQKKFESDIQVCFNSIFKI